ncbi:siderophore-interacting protein [Sulfurimicrobium lacus]|uniref:Siderophore-interacting protein n=1 Tax=Sulfurimicrobium lacus TaxID=2715678 RepID=A0A6F8VAW5_9PROT|nr:MucB/RseB C-terminal domain-containing protein [Sulfurimicrobium lacus]BCB26983.1 siderophore-interacting protein [Sulfurimicrobium lacus]
MRKLRHVLLMLIFLPGVALAEKAGGDGTAWLQKMASAAHLINYSGTFVYRHDGYMETSRILHVSDASGEHEKLEVLDGPPREIVRNNDEVICYMPESKAVVVEKRKSHKSFPALLPVQLAGIAENYTIKLGSVERVAGYDCQNVMLEPRDVYRYGHRLCADSASGLLLKASTLNEKNEVVDQFFFTQASIGGTIDPEQLKSKYAAKPQVSIQNTQTEVDPGWLIKSPPAGFKKIMALKRSFPGKKFPTNHLVFSDQLAAVSVFIEPLAGILKPVSGLSSQGAINVYTKAVGEYQVTVLGEVPAATVTQIGNSVSFVAK